MPVTCLGGTMGPMRSMGRTGEPVRDDLVEGQQVLRLDDLERLEMMAVQLDEASAFLARKTVSHARLAFILLDNAAEVIMRRDIRSGWPATR